MAEREVPPNTSEYKCRMDTRAVAKRRFCEQCNEAYERFLEMLGHLHT
jgi:hypothetical protein